MERAKAKIRSRGEKSRLGGEHLSELKRQKEGRREGRREEEREGGREKDYW